MRQVNRYLLMLWIPIVAVLLGSCAKNPATGESQLALISEEQEIAYGRQSHPDVLKQFGVVEDEGLNRYFKRIGQEMAGISHRPDLPWTFTVVDDPLVNAFALPGGYIYFTRGILAYMNNEAEMAGVLGHEIAHVTARHSVNQLSKQQLFGLGLGLGSIFSPTFRQFSDLAQMGVGLLFLKYSRDDEREADKLGVEYMYKAGYEPGELSDFFTVFQRLQEDRGESIPSWLSSHPAPPDRIEKTAELAEQWKSRSGQQNLVVAPGRFLRRLEGVMYGRNPREGFSEDGHFYHPDLRFKLDYPSNWQVRNSKSAVLFLEPNQRAAIQLTISPEGSARSPRARAEEIASSRGTRFLEGESTRINGKTAFLGRYQVQQSQGNVLQVLAAFISHGDALYEIAGFSPNDYYRSVAGTFEETLTSFDTLRDPEILSVEPDRLQIYEIKRGGTLRDVAELFPNPAVTISDLSLLNRIDPDTQLGPGTLVKVVRSGR